MKRSLPGLCIEGMSKGAACLYTIARIYDKQFDSAHLLRITAAYEEPDLLRTISRIAEKIGFRPRCIELTYKQLMREVPLPCIIQSGEGELLVLLQKPAWNDKKKLSCFDPVKGAITLTKKAFIDHWMEIDRNDQVPKTVVLLLEPTFKFYNKRRNKENKLSWGLVLRYFRNSRSQLLKLSISLLITSMLQLIFPFLMQSIVDVGISTGDLNFVTLVLIAQVVLICSKLSVDLIRARLLLHVSTTLNLSILSDFWIKLTHLPVAYFDRQRTGNVLQNINDNGQIQSFLTGPALNTLYSGLNFIVFAIVLMMFKVELFIIFVTGVTLYFLWMRLFFKLRRKINHRIYHASSRENNMTLQMVQGMQEIRLQNIEQEKRWEWESIKASIFKLQFKNLSYIQLQQTGSMLINQSKDVLLTFLVAKLVIAGQLTLGAMLAVQYIIGQLSGPVEQFIGFMQNAQNAKISMERLNDIHKIDDEESPEKNYLRQLPAWKTITFNNISFQYPGNDGNPALKNIQLEIPEGKTTAIVGMSGSGKTTLLKLLLKFYENYDGRLRIGHTDFRDISPSYWRSQCGAVMHDSYIFNDTIAKNIVGGDVVIDEAKLREACRIANILEFIESLPQKFETPVGAGGMGISQGQKQRLLIARVVYKDPCFLFFDESTNALDVENEKCIMENLQTFLSKKTVVVVAHRLSTVINADKIIVLRNGCIIEEGDHYELSILKGEYFKLVRNQLELGV